MKVLVFDLKLADIPIDQQPWGMSEIVVCRHDNLDHWVVWQFGNNAPDCIFHSLGEFGKREMAVLFANAYLAEQGKEDYKKTYDEHWKKDIEFQDGSINRDQMMRELHDLWCMISEVSLVFDHVTGGMASKPNTHAYEIISLADEHYSSLHNEDQE